MNLQPRRWRIALTIVALTTMATAGEAMAAQALDTRADEPRSQFAKVKVEPLAKLFPFLDLYYRLDPARRTRFTIAYRLHTGDAAADARVVLLDGRDTVLPLSATGWFETIPSESDISRKLRVRIESLRSARFGVSLVPAVAVHPDLDLDPSLIVAALDQFELEVHGAGPLGVLIPHFRHVQFNGGRGALVTGSDGEAYSPPTSRGEPYLTAAALRHARSIHFDTAPERLLILPN